MPLIRHLEISRYKSTEAANRLLSKLAQASGWRDDLISRLSVARSLREKTPPDLAPDERKGKELRGETFFRSSQDPAFLPWAAAMIAEHTATAYEDDDEAFEMVVAHWHRGLNLLDAELDEAGGDFNTFLLGLARQAAELASTDALADTAGTTEADRIGANSNGIRAVTVPIGRVRPDADPMTITLNDTRKYSNCHMAISGMSGSGKTQLAMQMLGSAAKSFDTDTGIIFIDFAKGDVAGNSRFAESIGARVIRLPGDVLPVGPFHLPTYTPDAVRLAAEEKREVYSNLFPNIGPKQQGRLVEAILGAYGAAAGGPPPDLALVADQLNRLYAAEGLQPDSLTELFRRLNAYRLFWSRGDGGVVSPLYSQRWLVDIHELSGLKEVTAFTLIEQLYREMRGLPDSAIDPATGHRHLRCVLAIDEVQYYLKAKNRFLQGIIREGRSKGFAVMLMCQSPDDFDQADFDYTEQLQFTYMLQCKTSPKSVTRLLGVGREEAKRLSTELARMEPLHGVGRGAGNAGGASRFRIVPFFEMFT